MTPVEVVVPLDHEREVSQTKGTAADVKGSTSWRSGITGKGVRIAVLDTGIDPVHPDLDDLDFRHWSNPLNPAKIVDSRNFNGASTPAHPDGVCEPFTGDGHGHGTHVAGIAAGSGEGTPLSDDDGRYAGVAPGAELAIGKVLTDAGAGLNSDLIAAMEWAAMPDRPGDPLDCAIGAHIVNLSLGTESRPTRLNSGSDVDLVSLVLGRLAARYGTLFVAAYGNSGPFIGSGLETPGSAFHALTVAATAKDYDLNHDDTQSGDTCAGYEHPRAPGETFADNDCDHGAGTQRSSVSPFSSRGPAVGVWQKPDISAPGYNIVSTQAKEGAALAANDLNRNTRSDPLYATATGTSMAAPATAGSAALVLQAYRSRYGSSPTGASGVSGLRAPTYALLKAALMNSAGAELYDSRWILTTDLETLAQCPATPDPIIPILCEFVDAVGNFTLTEARNRPPDPYVGPFAEGAGKVNVGRAIAALRDGVVMYSTAASSSSATNPRDTDYQGAWQAGITTPGVARTTSFVVRNAPGNAAQTVRYRFLPGRPSDGSRAIPTGTQAGAWSVSLPGATSVSRGGSTVVRFSLTAPASAAPGPYTGVVLATTSSGQTLRIPVMASVPLRDARLSAGSSGAQSRLVSARDDYARRDTVWPSVPGDTTTGAQSDWLVYPVRLGYDLASVRFSVYDAVSRAANDPYETYDLYLYDSRYTLIASTHPFVTAGVTDRPANDARGPSTRASPQTLTRSGPNPGVYYVVVSRAKVGATPLDGDFGAFVLTIDEVAAPK